MSLDFRLIYIIDRNEIEVYSRNITHNLSAMAKEAGIYDVLWHPEERAMANEIILKLKEGLNKLKKDPEHYKQFNSSNGWGMYEHFVPFVEGILNACIKYPHAIIEVSI